MPGSVNRALSVARPSSSTESRGTRDRRGYVAHDGVAESVSLWPRLWVTSTETVKGALLLERDLRCGTGGVVVLAVAVEIPGRGCNVAVWTRLRSIGLPWRPHWRCRDRPLGYKGAASSS